MSCRSDHRQDPRLDVHIRVDYASRDMFISNYVTNLSTGGVFIQTENPLPIQSEIQLIFTLSENDTVIQAKGRVVWTYDIKKGTSRIIPGMGVKFTDLSPEQKTAIQNCIRKLSADTEAFSHK
ncbi:MAG: TIGR02266 family protein [Nitrospirae bacterium]|nr:TIGR02266 family protein [Nitrospirota bacterium]